MVALHAMEGEESPSYSVEQQTSATATTTNTTTDRHRSSLSNSPRNRQQRNDATDETVHASPSSSSTPPSTASSSSSSCVQVAVRVRPMLRSEAGSATCIEVLHQQQQQQQGPSIPSVVRIGGSSSGLTFAFDEVFDATTTQQQVFEHRVIPLLRNCLEGYNATIVAYGQTGSGKTFTIMGPSAAPPTSTSTTSSFVVSSLEDDTDACVGIIPRALRYLFDQLDSLSQQQQQPVDDNADERDQPCEQSTATNKNPSRQTRIEYDVRVQFLELYGEEIRDLLSPSTQSSSERLVIRDVGMEDPEVLGASQQKVSTAEEALLCLTRGMLRRVTGATAMNSSSSRSHAILSVLVEQSIPLTEDDDDEDGGGVGNNPTSNVQVKRSKFNFVDLAGSERQKRTLAEGQRLKEGIDINKGLLVLGNVISALGDPAKRGGKSNFVPYRDSKLTRLLKGSLGGNHKTLMIACISPSSDNMEESLNCLRYANRAKNIQNHAVVNVDSNTRLLSELKVRVQALATDLLQTRLDGHIPNHSSFTNEMLQSMIATGGVGGSIGGANAIGGGSGSFTGNTVVATTNSLPSPPPPRLLSGITKNNNGVVPATLNNNNNSNNDELDRIRQLLQRSQADLKEKEEQLSVSKAENEFQRMQLVALSGDTDTSTLSSASASAYPTINKDLFIQKASEYESEIAALKNQLRSVQREASSRTIWDDAVDWKTVEKANLEIEHERAQLSDLQTTLASSSSTSPLSPSSYPIPEHRLLQDGLVEEETVMNPIPIVCHEDNLEAEESAEHAEVSALTNKYLGDIDAEDEVDVASTNAVGAFSDDKPTVDDHAADEEKIIIDEVSAIGRRREKQLEAHLIELSHRIDAKEELIQQLQVSQERYASMRAFYEDKLRLMEQQVEAREREREQLVEELKRLVESNSCTKDLEMRLQDKEQHIAELRKRQRELSDFTRVSSKNESEIQRLRKDVIEMKQRKVELQKQVNQERKQHYCEIQRLKKIAMQKESEANKWKKSSSQWENQTHKAQQVAKARLEQLGQLRAKYKDAEKKVRMSSMKRGVMAKAGLDPVLVGRRDPRKSATSSTTQAVPVVNGSSRVSSTTSNPPTPPKSDDVDAMRDFLDQEIARISQQEALIDKLANEWEGHLELVLKREELMLKATEQGEHVASEEIDALDLQRQYKEDRIRQMVRRLDQKRRKPTTNSPRSTANDDFLRESDILKFCPGASPLAATRTAARVLFGMVVRERRRVAALARTASALDEKAQRFEQEISSNEAAFRSYVEEKRDELASITQNHQEQILSLMTMLREEPRPGSSTRHDSRMAVFANERIAALENQLLELQGEKEAKNMYRLQNEEVSRNLKVKAEECDSLQKKVHRMRSAIRQIRDAVSRRKNVANEKSPVGSPKKMHETEFDGDQLGQWILGILTDALHSAPPKPDDPKVRGRESLDSWASGGTQHSVKSSPPRVAVVGRTHSSESDISDELPDWAGDIMADLEFIAQGKVPPSLLGSTTVQVLEQELEKTTVFDRLSDPVNFTGVQKQKTDSMDPTNNPNPTSDMQKQKKPDPVQSLEQDIEKSTVFERLADPVNYTGIQKQKSDPIDLVGIQKQKTNLTITLDILKQNKPEGSPQHHRKQREGKTASGLVQRNATARSNDKRSDKATTNIKSPRRMKSRGRDVSSSSASTEGAEQYPSPNPPPRSKPKERRSVFERLLSPSSYTGTHKGKVLRQQSQNHNHQQQQEQPHRQQDREELQQQIHQLHLPPMIHREKIEVNSFVDNHDDELLDELLASSDEAHSSRHNSDSEHGRSLVGSKVMDYTQQNVFERLQRTTTQSYEVKKNTASTRHHGDQNSSSPTHSSVAQGCPSTVFQETSSFPFPKSREQSRENLSPNDSSSNYTSLNVFERLQKTTTQAYAQKQHPQGEHT